MLPHPKTISKWYQVINGQPGFSKEAFITIKSKAEHSTVLCNIVVDEMSIRENIEWDGKKMYGFVDLGTDISIESDDLPHAKNALVFMAVGINGHWKMPIGYFFINGLNGAERGNLLVKCLELMSDTNSKVHSITFDGAYTNIAMCRVLGSSFNLKEEENFLFLHPVSKEPVYIFYDPCHMLKLVRNTLGDKKCFYNENGRAIKWDYIKNLHLKQKDEGLTAATKLTQRHITYHNEKMNVKLASQVFSNSVSNALKFCKAIGDPKFDEVDATAEFCALINNAFDILNCRSMFSKNPYNLALNTETIDKYKIFISYFERYIFNLKFDCGQLVIESGRKTGFIGLVQCLKNLLKLYSYLSTNYALKYLLSFKLSQDHIETFFSSIRMRGGYNNNPSAKQFCSAYKKLLIHNQVSGSQYGNCISILDQTELSIVNVGPDSIIDSSTETENVDSNITMSVEHNYLETISRLTPFVENVSAYIAGFVVKQVIKKINCSICIQFLSSKNTENLLINLKNRNNALIKPCHDAIYICATAEREFRSCPNVFLPGIKTKLYYQIQKIVYKNNTFSTMNDHCIGQELFNNHKNQIIALIINKYLELRFHHASKIKTKSNEIKLRKKLTKLILFRNE